MPSATDDETQILSVPIRLRRCGREITTRIDGTDPFATAKPDARLIKLLIRARRFNTTFVGSDGVHFATLANRKGVSLSYFTRLVCLSYLKCEHDTSAVKLPMTLIRFAMHGVAVTEIIEPGYGKTFYFHDPNGIRLQIELKTKQDADSLEGDPDPVPCVRALLQRA